MSGKFAKGVRFNPCRKPKPAWSCDVPLPDVEFHSRLQRPCVRDSTSVVA